jgi:hypothetical protein
MNVRRWPGLTAMDFAVSGGAQSANKNTAPLMCIIAVDSGMTIFAKLKRLRDV